MGKTEKKSNPDAIAFGKKLRGYRKAAGLTQAELADKLEKELGSHISRTALASYETGDATPPWDKLADICYILKIDYWSIFGLDADASENIKKTELLISCLNYLGYGLSGSGLYGSPQKLSKILAQDMDRYTFEIVGNGNHFSISGEQLLDMLDISLNSFEMMLNKEIEKQINSKE